LRTHYFYSLVLIDVFDISGIADMAEAGKAEMLLLAVVPEVFSLAGRPASLSRYLPGTFWAMEGITTQNLEKYLENMLIRTDARGVTATGEIRYGKVVKMICETADGINADLIVLATHGKAGTEAFWANSVAAQVQKLTTRPLLLCPV
jgi:nucleotide-binding universal stress UspA family protein